MPQFDAIVVGLGAMGSATLCHLARAGCRVLGIDRHSPPHAFGSSHGDTRITRLAIGEGAQYTPLALRSHELWRELESTTGESLLTTCGGLIVSSPATDAVLHVRDFFATTVGAAQRYGIAHEILDAAAIQRRFPLFKVSDDEVGYFEHDAGFLRPERCIRAHLAMAAQYGATIARDECVAGFDATASGVTVTTQRDRYPAETLVLSVGPWIAPFAGETLASHFKVYRQTLFWFDIAGPVTPFLPERFPIFIWEPRGVPHGIYGFPAIDGPHGGVKIATERFEHETTPEAVERNVAADEIATMYERCVAPHLSSVTATCLRTATCLYTVTPDFGFVIDRHPHSERVIVVSACSGHGFKHSPAIGEAVSQLVLEGASRLDLGAFSARRFERG